jgi:hypothetical protein
MIAQERLDILPCNQTLHLGYLLNSVTEKVRVVKGI